MQRGVKINYIFNVRFPTERAHGIQVAKMCEAFADLGFDVELAVPNRDPGIRENAYSYYKVRDNFKIKKLWCLDSSKLGKLRFPIQTLTFLLSVIFYSLRRRGIFYTRDSFVAAVLRTLGKRTVWEAHMGIQNIFTKIIFAAKVQVVVITHGLKELYISVGGHQAQIYVAPDGVDLEHFTSNYAKKSRESLGWPNDKKVILYSGHLYPWKGAHTLAHATSHLGNDLEVILIGGTDKDLDTFQVMYGQLSNLRIMGKRPYSEIPTYLRLADVLVLPNSAKKNMSKSYTSPMKLFEYMTSKVPIVASDLPSIREVLTEDDAYFFRPDDPEDLTRAINDAVMKVEESKMKSQSAYGKVQNYSWRGRAQGIIDFVYEENL